LGIRSSGVGQDLGRDACCREDDDLLPRRSSLTCGRTEIKLIPLSSVVSVVSPASLVPSLDVDVHLVLCDFGRSGLAYVETDPTKADATTIVRNLLQGQYERPIRVVALNADEGWARDVSENIAVKIRDVAQREGRDLTSGTRAFIEAHSRTIPTFW
jgi:hypothetical protein